jgi:hypothetical protein
VIINIPSLRIAASLIVTDKGLQILCSLEPVPLGHSRAIPPWPTRQDIDILRRRQENITGDCQGYNTRLPVSPFMTIPQADELRSRKLTCIQHLEVNTLSHNRRRHLLAAFHHRLMSQDLLHDGRGAEDDIHIRHFFRVNSLAILRTPALI